MTARIKLSGRHAHGYMQRDTGELMKSNRMKFGRGTRRTPGQMNGMEREYAARLELRRLCGEITEYHFDAVKLRLAEATFYTPDFLVMMADGEIEFHEVKGHWEDDARVKIKVAADKYPFRFVALKKRSKKDGGGWAREEF